MLEIIPWMIYEYKWEHMPCKLNCWEALEVEYFICEVEY